MENKTILEMKHSAESVFLSRALFKCMSKELALRMPVAEAENLYYSIGISAGEDYCYNFINLEDSIECFLKEIESVCEPVCCSKISVCSISSGLETIEVSYPPFSFLNEKPQEHCRMRCQLIKGLICGILCAYTGSRYDAEQSCYGAKKENYSLPCISKFVLASDGDTNMRAPWDIKK